MKTKKKIPMWITQDDTLQDLGMIRKDTEITNLRFVYVDFTDAILTRLQDFQSREFETICLFSCRGKVAEAISFFLSLRIQEFVINTFLPDNSFDDAAAMALANGLEATTTLKRLHLHGCLVCRQFPDALRRGLSNCPSLEHLEFNLSYKLERCSKVGKVLAEVLPTMPNLNKLEFRKNQLQQRQLSSLLKGLSKHSKLQELEICISTLDMSILQELKRLAERKENNIQILNLFIEDHQFNLHKLSSEGSCSYCITPVMIADAQDMEYLGKVAVQNSKIQALDLSYLNNKDDEIVRALAPWIAKAKGLRQLNIEGFRLGQAGGQALVMAMSVNTSLDQVILSSRCIYSTWITHFADWNKAGRRILQADDIPDALWSHVLSRASTIAYQGGNESIDHEKRSANAIFHLLRSQVGLWGSDMM